MKFIIFAVFLSTAVQMTLADIKFRSCGASTVKKVTFVGTDNKPTPTVQRGKTYIAKVEYIAKSSPRSLTTTWFAILGGSHVKWDDVKLKDGCAATKPSGCPVEAGKPYVYEEELIVPSMAPAMRTVIKIRQTSETGAEHLCAIMSLLIK